MRVFWCPTLVQDSQHFPGVAHGRSHTCKWHDEAAKRQANRVIRRYERTECAVRFQLSAEPPNGDDPSETSGPSCVRQQCSGKGFTFDHDVHYQNQPQQPENSRDGQTDSSDPGPVPFLVEFPLRSFGETLSPPAFDSCFKLRSLSTPAEELSNEQSYREHTGA